MARCSASGPDVSGEAAINALPAELFLDILLRTLYFDHPLIRQLHKLAQVCTYWHQSILADSRFWPALDLSEQRFAPAVVRRNPSGPLTVRCRYMAWENPADEFIKVARSQAHRWKTLEISGDGNWQVFDFPTPALVTLHVTSSHDRYRPLFPLSPSSELRHVAVSGIHLPWDSASFAGLRSLSIRNIHLPLRQIATIISATPALEWLSLREITAYGNYNGGTDLPEQAIVLPALRGLYLQRDIDSTITHHLLKTINGPQCRYLEAPITFQLLQHSALTFGQLAAIPIRAANWVRVDYFGQYVNIEIHSPMLPDFYHHNGWRSESGEAWVSISITQIPYPSPNALESVIDILPLNVNQADVMLGMQRSGWNAESAQLFGNHPAIWDSATHIYWNSDYRPHDIAADLQFLATPVIENGRGKWPCSRLASISVADPLGEGAEEVAHAILDFLEKRSSARVSDGGSATEADIAWDIPVPLEIIKAKEGFLGLVRGAKVAEGVQLVIDNGRF